MTTAYTAQPSAHCRACTGGDLVPWLDLGAQPPANALRRPGEPPPPTFPLRVHRCTGCGLSQLDTDVSAVSLYDGYAYRSGTSATFRAHLEGLAAAALDWFQAHAPAPHVPPRVLDIGANDGALLAAFGAAGVPPTHRCGIDAAPCPPPDFEGTLLAGIFPWTPTRMGTLPHAQFDVITTLNTFNAVEHVHATIGAVGDLLAPDGTWIVEVPALDVILHDVLFDTIYHEHRTYWLATTFARALAPHRLELRHVERIPHQGGSLRFWVGHETGRASLAVGRFFAAEAEAGLLTAAPYVDAQDMVNAMRDLFWECLDGRVGFAGYGSAAKATVLASAYGLTTREVAFLVDDAPSKQGMVAPWGPPILAPDALAGAETAGVIIFAWNFAREVRERLAALGYRGTTITPLPHVEERAA